MTEAEWLTCERAEELLDFLSSDRRAKPSGRKLRVRGVGRKLRLLMAHCCRNALHDQTENAVRRAVDVLESFADNQATVEELREVHRAVADRAPARSLRTALVADAVQSATLIASVSDRRSLTFAACEVVRLTHETADMGTGLGSIEAERSLIKSWVHDIFGNPFRPVTFSPSWRTDTALSLARQMDDARDFSSMPILADAFQDAGCDNDDILDHCRDMHQIHVRGCWVVDMVLGK